MKTIISEKKNIKIGAIISYLTLFLNIVVNFFYTPFLLNKVGDSNYGLWSFATSITSWFTVLVYALFDSYVRFATKAKKDEGTESGINGLYLKIMAIISFIILILSAALIILLKIEVVPLNKYDSDQKNIISYLLIISIIQVIATTLLSIFKLFSEYKGRFIFVKLIALIQVVVIFATSVFSLFLKPSILFIAIISVSVNVISLIAFLLFSLFKLKMHFDFRSLNNKHLRTIIPFTVYLLIMTVVSEINSAVDKTLLGFFAGAELVTIYQIGMSFNIYFSELSSAVNSLFIPKINSLVVEDKKNELNSLFLNISEFQTFIVTLIAGGFACCGYEFVVLWVGVSRIKAFYIGLILLILSSVEFSSYSSISIQRACSKHKIPAYINLGITLLNVAISVILLIALPDEFAILACLSGTAFSSIVGKWIILPIYNKKEIGLPIGKFYINFLSYLFISIISLTVSMILCNYIFSQLINSLFLQMLIKGLIFLFLFFLLISIFKRNVLHFIRRKKSA